MHFDVELFSLCIIYCALQKVDMGKLQRVKDSVRQGGGLGGRGLVLKGKLVAGKGGGNSLSANGR